MNEKGKQRVLMLAIKLFGSCEPYAMLALDNDYTPVLVRHDGHGTELDKAYWNGNEWAAGQAGQSVANQEPPHRQDWWHR